MENNRNINIKTNNINQKYAKIKIKYIADLNYFEFENNLYIKLILHDSKLRQPTCYNITQSCISYLELDTDVFLCANVTINYNLWINKNGNIL